MQSLLQTLAGVSLRFRSENSEAEDLGLAIADEFAALPRADRAIVTGSLDPATGQKLVSLSGRLAERAMNTRDPAWLKAALTLHVIEDFRNDYRENIRHLVLVSHAAIRIDADLATMIAELEPIGSTEAAGRLLDFARRDRSSTMLTAYDIEEEVANGKSRFVHVPAIKGSRSGRSG